MKRPEKEAVIAELTDKFRNADAIYLTEYRGLTVPQISELREKLGRDTSYAVAKNTLARIAANGNTSSTSTSPTTTTCAIARASTRYARQHPEQQSSPTAADIPPPAKLPPP